MNTETYTYADSKPIRIRRTDNPPRANHRDVVQTVASSLALRLQHSLLTKVIDGTATIGDRTELAAIAREQSREETGGTRLDMLSLARLAESLKSASYSDRWHHVDSSSLRSSREFAGV